MATTVSLDGRVASPKWQFSAASDQKIVAVVALSHAPAGTVMSYTRYLNEAFVDSKSSTLTTTATSFNFEFAPIAGQKFAVGSYRLRVYVNNAATWEVRYTVVS
jgi:hypothetical protein